MNLKRLKPNDIVNAIRNLGIHKSYRYFSTPHYLEITSIEGTEGPIRINRWDSKPPIIKKSAAGISKNQIGIIAAVFSGKPNYPIHFDRLFSAGGNSRSALESLLALTPNFFYCYPMKTNLYTGQSENKLKHLMWCPDRSHELGKYVITDYDNLITEVELGVDYGQFGYQNTEKDNALESIETQRTHSQMQVALIELGQAMNLRSWIAKHDQSITVGSVRLGDLPGVINDLSSVEILYNENIKRLASLIDCIWISTDCKYIPAVFEIEHSTGVTSGLTRMSKFYESIPSIKTNFVIVAPDLTRNKVVSEINQRIFKDIKAQYLSYTTLRELFGLIRRFPLAGKIEPAFFPPFLENVIGSESE